MPRKPKKQDQARDPSPAQHVGSREKSVEELIGQVFPGGFTLRDEANVIVACAFRNGPLEDLHAGKYSPLLEDRSLSRITDEEMKTLMLFACRKVEELLRLKDTSPDEYAKFLLSYTWQYCRKWER